MFRATEGDCEGAFAPLGEIELGAQGEISIARFRELTIHFEVLQILPAIAGADVTDRASGKIRRATHQEMKIVAPGPHQAASAVIADRRRVVPPAALQMRLESCSLTEARGRFRELKQRSKGSAVNSTAIS